MKIRFIIISFIALILVGWGYAANKFENRSEDIIAILNENEEYITYDSIKVNKYSFSVTLNKVMFKPLDFYYDEVVIRHIPFLNITKIDTYGNDVKITTAQDEESIIYSPDHHTTVWIRKSLFNQSPDYLKISINQNKSSLYSSNIAEKLIEFNNNTIVITNTKTSDNLNLLDLDIKTNATFISDSYMKEISNKIFKFSKNKKISIFDFEALKLDLTYFSQLQLLNLPESCNYKLKLKYSDELAALNKLFFQSLFSTEKQDEEQDEIIFMQIVNEIYKGKPFLLTLDVENKGKIQNTLYKVSIDKDKKIDFVLNIKGTQEPSEIYESAAINAASDLYLNIINEQINTNFKLSEPITKDDYAKIIGFIQKINNVEFNLKGEFNPEDNKVHGNTKLIIDDFNFAVDINMPNLDNPMNLESIVTLSDPNVFINNFVNYTNNAIVPVLNKIEDFREFALILEKQASVIKQYGFGAAEAFSKNSELKDGESLVVKVEGKGNEITFNDKAIDQIFNDLRVTEFINAMAEIDQEKK